MVEMNLPGEEAKNVSEKETDNGLMYIIKKKYLWIMILII
jgi:hypothetical protein